MDKRLAVVGSMVVVAFVVDGWGEKRYKVAKWEEVVTKCGTVHCQTVKLGMKKRVGKGGAF